MDPSPHWTPGNGRPDRKGLGSCQEVQGAAHQPRATTLGRFILEAPRWLRDSQVRAAMSNE